MKKTQILFVLAAIGLPAGCTYRGAIYSEYSQCALDIRAAAQDANGPIKVNFGYDRGVLAYVPKRDASTNSTRGEAVSLISWNNTESAWIPPQITGAALTNALNGLTNSSISAIYSNRMAHALQDSHVIRIDAGFISGMAANVASAPSNADIIIRSDSSSTNTNVSFHTDTDAGARIGTAVHVMYSKAVAEWISKEDVMIDQIVIAVGNPADGTVDVAKLEKLLTGVTALKDKAAVYAAAFQGRPVAELRKKLSVQWRDALPEMIKNIKT